MGVGLQGTNIVSDKEAVRQERGVGSASILYQIVMLLSIGWRSNVFLLYGEHHPCSSSSPSPFVSRGFVSLCRCSSVSAGRITVPVMASAPLLASTL